MPETAVGCCGDCPISLSARSITRSHRQMADAGPDFGNNLRAEVNHRREGLRHGDRIAILGAIR